MSTCHKSISYFCLHNEVFPFNALMEKKITIFFQIKKLGGGGAYLHTFDNSTLEAEAGSEFKVSSVY